jgi:hypothetical protein
MIQELMVPGDYSHGATGDNTINCFPGKTMVRAWGIERSYRRWYKGSMVTIHTALGDELSATPNHPVLSSRGWVAVGLLKEGDYLVRCSLGDGQPPDVEGAPAMRRFGLRARFSGLSGAVTTSTAMGDTAKSML